MPLPLIPIGIAIASALSGAAASSRLMNGKNPQPTTSIGLKPMGNKQQMIFIASLVGAAANADGIISDDESKELNKIIDKHFKEFTIETDVIGIMKDRITNPSTIKQLRETYNSLGDINEDQKESYRKLVRAIISSDASVNLAEQVFLYKLELILEGLPNITVFAFDSDTESTNKDILSVLSTEDAKKKYPKTKKHSFNQDTLYTLHPASSEELVPITLFFDENFAQDKDTELVRISQLAGAKSVTITSYSKDEDSSATKVNVSAGAQYKVVSGGTDIKTAVGDIAEMEAKTCLKFTFEGRKFLDNFSSMIGLQKRNILSRTKWLKSDPKLSAFVDSCFGVNRVKSFDWDIEYTEIGNSMLSAAVAAKCKLPGFSANLKTSYENKAAKYTKRKNHYQIEF